MKLIATALLAFALTPAVAFGWGSRAHVVIDRVAIASLPSDGPIFLKNYLDYITASASLPDTWRGASEPFSKIEEDPNHGWFREQFAFLKIIPRSRYEFVLAINSEYLRIHSTDPEKARRMNVRWTGTLPYSAAEVYGLLVADMRLLRRAKPNSPEMGYLQQSCAFEVARLGHYIGDGGEPLHDTIHHDGWQGPNPKDYTRDPHIHGRFESQFVERIALADHDILPSMGPAAPLSGDVFDRILAYLDDSSTYVEQIYQMDRRNAFADAHDEAARELVFARTSAAARMLRDLLCRAWLDSAAAPLPVVPSPVDSANPLYNPETGSAPAAR